MHPHACGYVTCNAISRGRSSLWLAAVTAAAKTGRRRGRRRSAPPRSQRLRVDAFAGQLVTMPTEPISAAFGPSATRRQASRRFVSTGQISCRAFRTARSPSRHDGTLPPESPYDDDPRTGRHAAGRRPAVGAPWSRSVGLVSPPRQDGLCSRRPFLVMRHGHARHPGRKPGSTDGLLPGGRGERIRCPSELGRWR